MKIANVLSRKGAHFETVTETALLSDVVERMYRHSIGSVGIADAASGQIHGIVSQQEVTEALALLGMSALQTPATTLMRKSVPVCQCEDNAADVMRSMTRQRSRHAIVRTMGGAVAGLVSLGDLVAALLEDAQLESAVLRDMARSHLLGAPG